MFQLLKSGCSQMSFHPRNVFAASAVIAAELCARSVLSKAVFASAITLDADVLDEDVRRHNHQPSDAPVHRRVDKRDRTASECPTRTGSPMPSRSSSSGRTSSASTCM